MAGPIQSSINAALSTVGGAIDTALELKERKAQVKAQEATTAELAKQSKEAAQLREAHEHTAATNTFKAEVDQAYAKEFDRLRGLKKNIKLSDTDVSNKAWYQINKLYHKNPNRQTELGYINKEINPKTGKEYSYLDYSLARQALALQGTRGERLLHEQKTLWKGGK